MSCTILCCARCFALSTACIAVSHKIPPEEAVEIFLACVFCPSFLSIDRRRAVGPVINVEISSSPLLVAYLSLPPVNKMFRSYVACLLQVCPARSIHTAGGERYFLPIFWFSFHIAPMHQLLSGLFPRVAFCAASSVDLARARCIDFDVFPKYRCKQ